MEIFSAASLILLLGVLLWMFRPCEWSSSAELNRLMRRLSPNRLERFTRFSREHPHGLDRDFWQCLGGVKGLLQLFGDLRALSGILTICVDQGLIQSEDARAVWTLGRRQVAYSALACGEAVLCFFLRSLPHSAARRAVAFHLRASIQASNLLQHSGLQSATV